MLVRVDGEVGRNVVVRVPTSEPRSVSDRFERMRSYLWVIGYLDPNKRYNVCQSVRQSASEFIFCLITRNLSLQMIRTVDHSKKGATVVTAGTPQSLVDVGCAPHDPLLYQPDFVWPNAGADKKEYIVPVHSTKSDVEDDGMLSWVRQYHRDGFLVIPNALSAFLTTPVKIEPVHVALDDLISGRNERFAQAIRDRMAAPEGLPDFTSGAKIPWIQYEAGMALTTEGEILTPSAAPTVRKIMGFTGGYSPVMDAIVDDPNLLQLVSLLLNCRRSDEIELFQDMALLKPARVGREKPWHQDKAYFNTALDEPVVGCWIAIDDAALENGCLRFEKGGHRQGPQPHIQQRDFQIPDAAAASREGRVVAVPLPPGGLVLFDGLIPHGTPTNNDPHPRRALQFHWTRRNSQCISTAERVAIFSGDAMNG
jgi:phytanoyl-CoA hydroxylase